MNRDMEWLLMESRITVQDPEVCKRHICRGYDTDSWSCEQQGKNSQELFSCPCCSNLLKEGVSDGHIRQQL